MLCFSLIISNCEDRVLSFLIHLTGVSSKSFHFAKFIFYSFHFQPECCRNCSLSFLVHLVSTGVLLPAFFRSHSLLFPFQPERLHVLPCRWSFSFMSLQPQGFHNVPCSSFLMDCLQSRSSLLYSFF